jgi:hypothetical protein
MPIARFQMPDGRVARFEVPDGTTPEQAQAMIAQSMPDIPRDDPSGPQEGMGEAALIAAGRGTDKLVQGVRQAYNYLTNDQKTLNQMSADEAEKDKAYAPLRQKFPVATGMGEAAPALAAGFMTGGTSLVGGAAAAGLPSLLSYGTGEERLKRAGTDAAFGAAGAGAGKLLARALKPAGAGVAGASDDALAAAERIGYKPLPSQIANSPGMANIENYLLRTPGGSGTMQKAVTANQTALNRAGAKSMGEVADTLDEGVFGAAGKNIGREFERLQTVTKPQLGDDFVNVLADLEASNQARGAFRSKHVDHLVSKGLDLAAKGDLDGKAYKEIRTQLTNEALMMTKMGDTTTAGAFRDLRAALDKAAKESLSDADKAAWDTSRKQWQAFKTLGKTNISEGGNASAARAAAAVRRENPGFRAGGMNGDLADIARVGEAFKAVSNPNSGNQVTSMLFGNPFTGLPMLAGNKIAAELYMSPLGQRYFSRGLIDVGQAGQGLLSRAGVQGAIPAGRGLLGVE